MAISTKGSPSQATRAKLKHPVIDSDGHIIELTPLLMDYVRQVGGIEMAKRVGSRPRWSPDGGREGYGHPQWTPPWWVPTGHTLDHATGSLPRLLHGRMDELGLDFMVLYPTLGLTWLHWEDAETRQAICRAFNLYLSDLYAEFADRMTPAALVPMSTPQEAIAELEYAVKALGFKAIMIEGHAFRRQGPQPISPSGLVGRPDVFGIDSEYDYDPFWAKCIELGVSPTAHTGSQGFGFRTTSVFMYNHIGHFAATSEALCKALFFGGVTYRFPQLRLGVLECGVGWACNLYSDLIARWHKRGGRVIGRQDPSRMDKDLLIRLTEAYGSEKIRAKLPELRRAYGQPAPAPRQLDDFAACHIQRAEDIRDRFIPNFFFGCEADDPMNAWAFSTKVNPFGARLNAIFSSDISHWDVVDMTEPVHEAHELVERELIAEDDFRDFVFANPVRLYAGVNPDFFKGTRVEAEAAKVLASPAR